MSKCYAQKLVKIDNKAYPSMMGSIQIKTLVNLDDFVGGYRIGLGSGSSEPDTLILDLTAWYLGYSLGRKTRKEMNDKRMLNI